MKEGTLLVANDARILRDRPQFGDSERIGVLYTGDIVIYLGHADWPNSQFYVVSRLGVGFVGMSCWSLLHGDEDETQR